MDDTLTPQLVELLAKRVARHIRAERPELVEMHSNMFANLDTWTVELMDILEGKFGLETAILNKLLEEEPVDG